MYLAFRECERQAEALARATKRHHVPVTSFEKSNFGTSHSGCVPAAIFLMKLSTLGGRGQAHAVASRDLVHQLSITSCSYVDVHLSGIMMSLLAAKPWKEATFHFLCHMNKIILAHFQLTNRKDRSKQHFCESLEKGLVLLVKEVLFV
jgi:hypothetical protein